jgi:hypothetical protein
MIESQFENIFNAQAIAFKAGQEQERERILKEAEQWISDWLGHSSPECDCQIKAEGLQNFIDHSDFKGEK